MYDDGGRKYRDEETWEQVRRAWEGGETAQSCAKRFDVGIDNLWRRRAKGNWRRDRPEAPRPEPIEGWDRYARDRLAAFELQRDETRALAIKLAEAMAGGPLAEVPLWHVGFVLRWRAERLGSETAAKDRVWAEGRAGWLATFWTGEGRLAGLEYLDGVTLRANREAWREEMGLPPGEAEEWP